VVVGYQLYVDLVHPLLREGQEVIASPIGDELARARQAIELAAAGRRVALISSGDIGIYAMAGPVFELLRERGWSGSAPTIEVLPGISAVQAAAARLGAPISHDFCTISLSDLLTPWELIERRVRAAAWGDFVIAFYNPRSRERDWQLARAIAILHEHRAAETPVALARGVSRSDESIVITTLGELDPAAVDMFTLVLVGNSRSYVVGGHMATPRGYPAKTGGGTIARAGRAEATPREATT
jgi:cobalt-precorrin 5A hydrolase/precorrin-3B C17-methyltransferase